MYNLRRQPTISTKFEDLQYEQMIHCCGPFPVVEMREEVNNNLQLYVLQLESLVAFTESTVKSLVLTLRSGELLRHLVSDRYETSFFIYVHC